VGRKGSGDDRIVGVKPQEITGKWEIKPQKNDRIAGGGKLSKPTSKTKK
jgi:hypothetical protein